MDFIGFTIGSLASRHSFQKIHPIRTNCLHQDFAFGTFLG